MPSRNVTRRELLRMGAATAAAEVASTLLPGCGRGGPSPVPVPFICSKLTNIEHVVIFIQENRSFDIISEAIAACVDSPTRVRHSGNPILRIPRTRRLVYCCHSISTLPRRTQHAPTTSRMTGCPSIRSWDNGAMDGFVTSRLPINTNDAVLTMGYYTRADLPFYYAVTDAFTLCDNYFSSVIGPTDPNRLYTTLWRLRLILLDGTAGPYCKR